MVQVQQKFTLSWPTVWGEWTSEQGQSSSTVFRNSQLDECSGIFNTWLPNLPKNWLYCRNLEIGKEHAKHRGEHAKDVYGPCLKRDILLPLIFWQLEFSHMALSELQKRMWCPEIWEHGFWWVISSFCSSKWMNTWRPKHIMSAHTRVLGFEYFPFGFSNMTNTLENSGKHPERRMTISNT